MFEVTQRDWERVMGSNPAYFKNMGNTAPVEQVSWSDCQVFLKKLCDMEGVPQGSYRLLTEAEWEYACRAGTTAACAAGDWSTLDTMGWYNGSSSHPVGLKMANAWGLYDMHGNVSELCDDWYGDYPSMSVTDPKGPSSGILRVDRGGSWKSHGLFGGTADSRSSSSPNALNYDLGFRLLRISPQVEQKPKDMRFSGDSGLACN
jgi:formylglycine-generating enzyme required for sulfatase activity